MLGYLENRSTESTNFFTNLLLLLKALNHENLSKTQNFEFPSNARCLQSASLKRVYYFRDGETYTHAGLDMTRSMMTNFRHGARRHANKAAIVITDGRSTEPDYTKRSADRLHRYIYNGIQ